MEGGRANGEKGLAGSLALLPDPQEHICFDKTEFMRDNHRVEQFVSDCRRRVPLEKLREDLEQYFRLLKVSLVRIWPRQPVYKKQAQRQVFWLIM